MKCRRCGKQIIEDTTNPNVHYSDPKTICRWCERDAEAKEGDWLQDENGDYYQKRGEYMELTEFLKTEQKKHELFLKHRGLSEKTIKSKMSTIDLFVMQLVIAEAITKAGK